ncbi:MAG: histidine kinase [Xanthomonadaceae bacterium]|nr:histidine kinase [Xanthomonadaceae bacterium]
MAAHASTSVTDLPDIGIHWRLREYALYVTGWLLLGLWQGINSALGHRGDVPPLPLWQPLTWELSSTLTVGALALLVFRFEARFALGGGRTLRHLPLHALAAVTFSLLHVAAMVGLRKIVYALAGGHYAFGGAVPLFYEFQKDVITYAVIIGACVWLRTRRERHRRELDALRLARELSEARLTQLSAQVEPHFMFNALNTIASRMHDDVDAADRLLVALADLLRTALAGAQSPYARVRDELAWLRSYCALMGERQPGRLQVRIDADPVALTARMPRLLLQPLVENAFRHGLVDGRGTLLVTLRGAAGELHCAVSDDGAGYRAGREGIGLANVRERLRLLYGERAALEIAARPEAGTMVSVRLPLEPADA